MNAITAAVVALMVAFGIMALLGANKMSAMTDDCERAGGFMVRTESTKHVYVCAKLEQIDMASGVFFTE